MKHLPAWSDRFLLYEGLSAAGLGLAYGIWDHLLSRNWVNNLLAGDRAAVYATVTSVSGALLGLEIATASIIAGFIDKPRIRAIQSSAAYPYLRKTVISPIRWLGLATLIGLVTLIGDRESTPLSDIRAVLVTVILIALARIARSLWLLEELLKVPLGDETA